jgi:hypothetical protein
MEANCVVCAVRTESSVNQKDEGTKPRDSLKKLISFGNVGALHIEDFYFSLLTSRPWGGVVDP